MPSLQSLVQDSYSTLLNHSENMQIILLHPNSRYRSMVVAKLLDEAPKPVFYYAMGPYDVNVQSFLTGFLHDLSGQNSSFGRHLNQLGVESRIHPMSVLVDNVLADLDAFCDKPYLLILDEFDASEGADDVQELLERVLLGLPAHCQVLINSRTMPRLPWSALIAQNKALMIEDDVILPNLPKTKAVTDPVAHIEVRALGPGYIAKDGYIIEDWEGHLPRLLFIFALERPVVTRAEICSAFWPDLETEQAVNVFHVTKRRLHKALGFDALVHENGYYQINPHIQLDYDVTQFVESITTGRHDKNGLADWQAALDVYRGPFLQSHDDTWIRYHRAAYQAGYLEVVLAIAGIRRKSGQAEHALRMLVQAAGEYDQEALHREIMQIYAHLGRRSEAASHYQNLTETLKAKDRQPEPATQNLYHELMR